VTATVWRTQTLVHPAEETDLEGAALPPGGQGVALDNPVSSWLSQVWALATPLSKACWQSCDHLITAPRWPSWLGR
jgi:hypothetical protein